MNPELRTIDWMNDMMNTDDLAIDIPSFVKTPSAEKTESLTTAIADGILDGKFDEHLEKIRNAIVDRKEYITAVKTLEMKLQIKVGDRVEVVGELRPKYLIGLTGVVKKVNQKTVTLDFRAGLVGDHGAGRFRMPMEFVKVIR